LPSWKEESVMDMMSVSKDCLHEDSCNVLEAAQTHAVSISTKLRIGLHEKRQVQTVCQSLFVALESETGRCPHCLAASGKAEAQWPEVESCLNLRMKHIASVG
jgi:hypothetical protein